jgi:glutathione synthase
MNKHSACGLIVVVSRSHPANAAFFQGQSLAPLFGVEVNASFDVEKSREALFASQQAYDISSFHQVLLRLPKPNPPAWFAWLEAKLGSSKIINRPTGIIKTGSKAYLASFRDLCPPLQLCHDVFEVEKFRQHFPMVLKPLSDAGGKGLIKIIDDQVWDGKIETTWDEFLPELGKRLEEGMLAMEYLDRVAQGDKRILVVNGKIVGASLRLPAPGSWLCNVNMGGYGTATHITAEEASMAEILAQDLRKEGVIIFGFDTLENNEGIRVLSEINASCPGGFLPSEQLSGEPVIARTAHQLWTYLLTSNQHISFIPEG